MVHFVIETLKWEMKELDSTGKRATLKGELPGDINDPDTQPNLTSMIKVSFSTKYLVSGLEASVNILNAVGKPFKGIKSESRAGNFTVYLS